MRWDLEAIAKLREYTVRKAALDNLPVEIERLEQEYGRIRSATTDGTPVRGGGNAREDMLLSNICLREELKLRLADTQKWIATMDNALAPLTEEERLVLERFYINPHKGNVARLCEELSFEQASAYRYRRVALSKFINAFYGCA